MTDIIEQTVDFRGTPCPLNWVKTKLRLEKMQQGAILKVILDAGAPAENVPRSAALEGHIIQDVQNMPDGVHVFIEKR